MRRPWARTTRVRGDDAPPPVGLRAVWPCSPFCRAKCPHGPRQRGSHALQTGRSTSLGRQGQDGRFPRCCRAAGRHRGHPAPSLHRSAYRPRRHYCGHLRLRVLIVSQRRLRTKSFIWLGRLRRWRARCYLRRSIRSAFNNTSIINDDPSRWLLVRHFPWLLFCRETQSRYCSLVVIDKRVEVAKFPFRLHHTRLHREAKVRDGLRFRSMC